MAKPPTQSKSSAGIQKFWLYFVGILAGAALPLLATILVVLTRGETLSFIQAVRAHTQDPLLWLIDFSAVVFILLMLIGMMREQRHARRVIDLQDKIAQRIGELYNLKDIYHREIHQRQRAENSITRAKREWETTFDAIPDLILLTDSHGKILRCNQTTIQKLECAYSDILGKPIEEVFPGVVEPIQKRVINKTQIIPMPSRYGWFDVTGFQYQFMDDKPGMIYIFRDIAERKSSEAELQRQKQYFEAIFQNSPVAIVTIDLSNRIVTSNPTFEYLFGYSAAEAAGRKLEELILPPEYHDTTIEYTRRIHRIDVHHEVSRRLTKRGQSVDVEIFTVPVVVNSEPLGTLVLFHNITDLVQARRKAEEADIAKSAFLANISHEIRTPLNGLIGLLDMTLDTALSPTQIEYLSTAADQAEELLSLLNEILDLSKIEAGRMQLEYIPFDLRTVMENVALTMAQHANGKGIELVCVIPPDVPVKLHGDPNRLRQVLSNLTANAVKFTDQGEVVLSVQPVSEDGNGALLHFSVQDTGIGIPADRQAAIFDRFIQADRSTPRKYGGSGLGLSISGQIVEMMGGKISLESENGVGSIFSFTIPFEKLAENEPPSEALLEHSRGSKVLLVDQNPNTCQNLRFLFEALECRTAIAATTDEALKLIEQAGVVDDPFQLVVVEAQLTRGEDSDILRAIRSGHEKRPVKIITLNRMGEVIAEGKLSDLGIDGVVLKPVRRQPLYNVLYEVLTQDKDKTPKPVEHRVGSRKTILKTLHPQRILLAEDNPTNRKVVINLLEKFGHAVTAVENGLQAVEALNEEGYNLILMDVTMPELDGHAAVARIRLEEGLDHHTPVIALSGHTSDVEVEHCLASGMDACLFKPIRPKELFDAVEKWAAPVPDDRPWVTKKLEKVDTPQTSESDSPIPIAGEIDDHDFAEFSSTFDKFIILPPGETTTVQIAAPDETQDQDMLEISRHPFGSPDYLLNILPRFGNDGLFFTKTFGEFILECRSHLYEIRQAAAQRDTSSLKLLAHNLKGAAANFEVISLTTLLANLEAQISREDFSAVENTAAAMEDEIPPLEKYLVEIRTLK